MSKAIPTSQRLSKLRAVLKSNNLNAWVAPTDDAHSSELSDVAPCDARREYISGFDGSAGVAVVSEDKALLFTDGRYFVQAEAQLDSNWTLMKRGEKDVPTWQEWLATMADHSRIGIDASTVSINDAQDIQKSLSSRSSELVPLIEKNLIDEVWADRPPRPAKAIVEQPVKYAGQNALEKIEDLRKDIAAKNASYHLVTALDEVCWLLNLRGSDIDYNPVFFSFVLVGANAIQFFVDEAQLSKEIKSYLQSIKVEVHPYNAVSDALKQLPKDQKILITEAASWAVAESIGKGNYEVIVSPVAAAKAIKNEVEIEGFRQCHIRDGAALTSYFAWLEEELQAGKKIDEVEGAAELSRRRAELDLFKGLSFPVLSSSGPNGAIIHYHAHPETCAQIDVNALYLCDSGGQYQDGTTDVTRTLHFGKPTQEEIRANTAVLKGHIAIDQAIFPQDTTGLQIDCLARTALWREGLDFRHGTGHGVGSYLNVHEGPQSISYRLPSNKSALKKGMTISNEPGFYKDGHFGIRIENVLVVKDAKTANDFGGRGYLGFENFTMTPIQTKLVDKSSLLAFEVDWLNSYHKEVQEKLSPLLQNDKRALAYLERECKAI